MGIGGGGKGLELSLFSYPERAELKHPETKTLGLQWLSTMYHRSQTQVGTLSPETLPKGLTQSCPISNS